MKGWIITLVAISFSPSDLMASERETKHFYYNRPGATLANLDGDTKACVARSTGKPVGSSIGVGASAEAAATNAAIAAVTVGLLATLVEAAPQRRFVDECLKIKRWRQIFLSEEEAKALGRAIDADRRAALTPIVGAEPVRVGSVGPAWQNSYAQPRITEKGVR